MGTEIGSEGIKADDKICRDPNEIKNRAKKFTRVYTDAQKRIQRAYTKSKERYDLRHRRVEYYENQVWRCNFVLSDVAKGFAAKLAKKFVGPFLIEKPRGERSGGRVAYATSKELLYRSQRRRSRRSIESDGFCQGSIIGFFFFCWIFYVFGDYKILLVLVPAMGVFSTLFL